MAVARQFVAVSRADQWIVSRRQPRRLRRTEGQPGGRGLAGCFRAAQHSCDPMKGCTFDAEWRPPSPRRL
eukprot:3150418-Prymnesium_polylepis.1